MERRRGVRSFHNGLRRGPDGRRVRWNWRSSKPTGAGFGFTERRLRCLPKMARCAALIAAFFDATSAASGGRQGSRRGHDQLRRLVDSNIAGVLIGRGTRGDRGERSLFKDAGGDPRRTGGGKDRLAGGDAAGVCRGSEHCGGRSEEVRERGTCTPFETEYVRRDGSRMRRYFWARLRLRAIPR